MAANERKMHRFIILNIILFSVSFLTYSQEEGSNSKKLNRKAGIKKNTIEGKVFAARIENNDTIIIAPLPIFRIATTRYFKNTREKRKYLRLKKNVKIVYPYAKLAGQILEEYGAQLDTIQDKRKRKKILKQAEKELIEKYEKDVFNLTITQGKILLKLIDRETDKTSHSIIKEMRGGFSAFFWQSLAKLFDQDLKSHYDPEGEDKEIENIVLMIESGTI